MWPHCPHYIRPVPKLIPSPAGRASVQLLSPTSVLCPCISTQSLLDRASSLDLRFLLYIAPYPSTSTATQQSKAVTSSIHHHHHHSSSSLEGGRPIVQWTTPTILHRISLSTHLASRRLNPQTHRLTTSGAPLIQYESHFPPSFLSYAVVTDRYPGSLQSHYLRPLC